MEKKKYYRPLSKAVEINASSLFASSPDSSSLSLSSEAVDATDARANERNSWAELDDMLDF